VKDQHYIPKFYLKGFTDKDGKVWVCEKFKPMRASLPKDIAHRPDYYTHENDGKRDETAEQILMESESRAAAIIRTIAKSRRSDYVPTPKEIAHLMMFVAYMFARVPAWRDFLDEMAVSIATKNLHSLASDKARFHQSCIDFERKTGKSLGIDFEETLLPHTQDDMLQLVFGRGLGLQPLEIVCVPRDCGGGYVVKVLAFLDELLEFGQQAIPPDKGSNAP
jgi:hypothetical protein